MTTPDGPGRCSERCVCGGVITAPEATWQAVADAVALHNAGPLHTAWRMGLRLIRDERTWSRDGLGVAVIEPHQTARAAGGSA